MTKGHSESGGVLMCVTIGMRCQPGIVTVNVDRYPPFACQTARSAHVVEVAMGDDQIGDGVGVPAEFTDGPDEGLIRPGESAVDEDQPISVLDDVLIRVRVIQPVNAWYDVAMEGHARAHTRWGQPQTVARP